MFSITLISFKVFKKNMAPKIIIKMSKAMRNPFISEAKRKTGRIFQIKAVNKTSHISVANEAKNKEVLFPNKSSKKITKGVKDNKNKSLIRLPNQINTNF